MLDALSTRIPLNIIISIISAFIALFAVILSLERNRQEKSRSIRESTEDIFKEWWSEELRDLRKYFLNEFIFKHRASLINKSMKDIEKFIPEDNGRTRRLCYFFDRVGWLGASGLIDVDYVLGPMQHTMRRTWFVMEPLISRERELGTGKHFDPVFQFGFEWLFMHSCRLNKQQALLLGHRFLRPRIRTKNAFRALQAQIEEDENNFKKELHYLLEPA
jgi:hypothetical protein